MSEQGDQTPRNNAPEGGAVGDRSSVEAETPVIDRLPSNSRLFAKPPRPPQKRTAIQSPAFSRRGLLGLAGIAGVLLVGVAAFFAVRALNEGGCDTFDQNRTSISGDGLTVLVPAVALDGPYGVKLDAVVIGQPDTPGDVADALDALPAALRPVGKFHIIRSCQNPPHRVQLQLDIPVEVEALAALDLYAWDAEARAWRWVGGQVNDQLRTISTFVAKTPPSLLMVQTEAAAPVVGAEMQPVTSSVELAPPNASELTLLGMYLGDAGAIGGDRSRLYAAGGQPATLVPSIRNWSEKGAVNRTLLNDMLLNDDLRAGHAINLVNLAVVGEYAGIEIDYRGLDAQLRPQFSAFITQLAAELHAKGKQLYISLPLPMRTQNANPSLAWDWLGYDTAAISAAADVVRLDFSTDPSVFEPETLKSLMNWVIGRVNRYRLQLVLPSLSTKLMADGGVQLLSMEEALAPLGTMQSDQPLNAPLQPGTRVRFTLRGAVDPAAVQFDEATQTYRYFVADSSGAQETVWLGTAASLERRLALLAAYATRGVTVRGINLPGNDPGVAQVVGDYTARTGAAASSAPAPLQIAWSVTSPDGAGSSSAGNLSQPYYEWTVPSTPGNYVIAAAVQGGSVSGVSRGTQSVQVAALPTATPMPTATPEPTAVVAVVQPTAAPTRAADQPAAPTAAPPPPPPPSGNYSGFGLGGHIRTMDYLGQMSSIGMTWVKYQIVMPSGVPDLGWMVNLVHGSGMKLLIGAVGDRGRASDTGYHREFAQALAAVAAQGVDAIEVWNEPNLDREYGYGKVDGANYTNMLREAYIAIKAANPGTMVISGANAPTGAFGGGCSASGCDDSYFLARMAEAGAANYMDCVGAHHNGTMVGPDQTSGAPVGSADHYQWYFWGTLNMTYNTFGGRVPVCWTELGYVTGEGIGALPGGFSWGGGITLANHAEWLARAAQLSAQSGKVRIMIIWNIDFRQWDDDPQAGFSIFRPDGSCPACQTLRAVMGR